MVKVRDGQVANRPVYAAIGVDLEGHKDILGMWFGDGDGESDKYWMAVLTELRNRGVTDVFFLVCDGLKGLPASVNAVWPATIVQTCLIHYADLLIMPMWSLDPLQGSDSCWEGRHNQSCSSQVMRLSEGWYRPVRLWGGLVRASAFSFSSRSACR